MRLSAGGHIPQLETATAIIAVGFTTATTKQPRRQLKIQMSSERLCYASSIRCLQELGLLIEGVSPPMPTLQPRVDQPYQGVAFIGQFITKEHLSELTLCRTLFAKSEFNSVNFSNTDLTESHIRECKHICGDFADAKMNGCLVTACNFIDCNFNSADLRLSDLRYSMFDGCVFNRSRMDGVILTNSQRPQFSLSEAQCDGIEWRDDDTD